MGAITAPEAASVSSFSHATSGVPTTRPSPIFVSNVQYFCAKIVSFPFKKRAISNGYIYGLPNRKCLPSPSAMARTVPLLFHHSSVPFASVNTTSIDSLSASLPALIRSAKVGALVMAALNVALFVSGFHGSYS